MLESLRETGGSCACEPAFEGDRLVVDAGDCPGGGRLATAPDCRATVVGRLRERDAERVAIRHDGRVRAYLDGAAALLVAAGRFAERVAPHDERLVRRAARDPIAAAREAVGRAAPVARIAAETGLAAGAERADDYERALCPHVGPTVSHARFRTAPPPDARLREERTLDTGATVRLYDRPDGLPLYHLTPVERTLDDDATATLSAARDLLASGAVTGERAPRRAVRRVADDGAARLGDVLAKHAGDLGVFVDLFADPAVSDAFATAPVAATPLRVRVDGDLAATNVRLTERGASALASGFRLESGRAFSRASPTLAATTTAGDRRVRVAGTTDPVSDGLAFTFRARDRERWRLPDLVANGTLPPDAAALLSLAVERGAAVLLAGTRGAGKTTLLGALLWELPRDVRTVVIEDTPELPIGALQDDGRDVQALVADAGDGPGIDPESALRTALRLGEGALVVGEVRGEEAAVLYEAMRVGAGGSAVLGTIHGEGAAGVRERVVSDLGVPASSFAVTDLIVTLEPRDVDGERCRRVAAVEEVIDGEEGARFAHLFDETGDGLAATGRIERGNSRLVETLATPGGSYAAVRERLDERAASIRERAGGVA